MTKVIDIEPLTRLEGHGKLTIKLTDDEKVDKVMFSVTSTRFFEKFLEGRAMEQAPRITPRICGICPVPHHLASSKAVDDAWGLKIPKTAENLRRLMINAKQISSHALHFFALAAPDFVFGPLADPKVRNVVGIIKHKPEWGKNALEIMKIAQQFIYDYAGKAIHPMNSLPGGVAMPLPEDVRDKYVNKMDRLVELTEWTVDLANTVVNHYLDVIKVLGTTPLYSVGITNNGVHDIYDGKIRVMDPDGKVMEDRPPQEYLEFLGEYVSPHSLATHIFYKPTGYPEGIWDAGPLPMLNIADKMKTPMADKALKDMQEIVGKPCHMPLVNNWARIIELVEAVEMMKTLLEDSNICGTDVKLSDVEPREGVGVGCVEAPRGMLIHNYWSDEKGLVKKANLIVATNNSIGAEQKVMETMAKQIFDEKVLDKIKIPDPIIPT
ncbi:MAG: Ni/Fe hydrogenase subunit alpha [Promethearchaeota archaeon]|nr:MAG: Ni/Fe hydrogenase subunit alpha [Candidatus Lokiarchaeota archaeon]